MFNEINSQIDQAYIQTTRHTIDTAGELAKMLIEIIKALKQLWDEKQENDKVAVKLGEETYNLVEDKDTPGAYKWEKVDLNNEQSPTNDKNPDALQYSAELEQPFTEYQAQTLATKLISDRPGSDIDYEDFKTINPAIQITLSNDDGERVLYELSDEGECVKNTFTEELSQEQIIDVAYEPLSKILPPGSHALLPPSKDDIEAENAAVIDSQENLTIEAMDMLSQVVDKLEIESQNNKYDADGLVVDNDAPSTPIVNYNNPIEETNTENIQYTELPEFDDDGLVVDNINTNVVNTQNNEAIEQIKQTPTFDAELIEVTQQEAVQQEFDTDGLVVSSNIKEALSTDNQLPEFKNDELETKTTGTPTIDSTSLVEEFDADGLVVEETNVNAQNTGVIDYIQPVIDDVGFANDIDISNPPDFDGPPDDYEYSEAVNSVDNAQVTTNESNQQAAVLSDTEQPSVAQYQNEARFIAGATASDLGVNDNFEDSERFDNNELYPSFDEPPPIKKANTQVEEEESSPIIKRVKTQAQEEPAKNYTYRQIASSPEVEPRAQQWARQSTIPVYEIKHKGEKAKVEFEKNKDIANAATEMLKKYGTIEKDGSIIYRSDAFAIRKVDGVVSIHRRGDEAKGFTEPRMQFKLDKEGVPDIKGANLLNNLKRDVTQNNMLPVEKQEFLIVAERISEGKGLPDLQSGDVREMGNALGSLAPAGTLRTLDTFKKSEMLEMLNSTLNQAKRDEVKVGEFTIKRERDPENNRASLVLTKDSDDSRGKQELVRFNLEKTPDGIKTEVAKMNISDYDIGQIKYIVQNAYKLDNKNLESNFDSGNNPLQPQSQPLVLNQTPAKTTVEDSKSIGDIPVNVHPWIAEEWQKMAGENPLWQDVMGQDNEELLQKLEENGGKLPIADQREMYDKIMIHKVTQAQASGDKDAIINFIAKKDITADLMNERSRVINKEFTPGTNVSKKQAQVKREVPRQMMQTQGVEL